MDSASKVVIDVLAEKILYLEYANDLMRAENDRLREKLEEKKDQQLEVADRKVNANAWVKRRPGRPVGSRNKVSQKELAPKKGLRK